MIGQTISRYRILSRLGEGAMGEVYRAEHIHLHHPVAIKILKNDILQGEQAQLRFRREAEIAASLDNPSLCNVIDFGEHEGRTYLVMRYCEGPNLKQVLDGGPLPIDQAVLYAIQIAEGLEAAHQRGVVHRDLKPSNIVVGLACPDAIADDASTVPLDQRPPHGSSSDLRSQARIVDFGLALMPETTRVTATGGLVGTPAYMAPEQVTGAPVDQRVDLWALGAILHEMVAGQPAFRGDTAAAVLDAIRHANPISLSSVCPAIPAKLTWIATKALRKLPDDRYQDACEMLVDLRSLHADLRAGDVVSRPTWVVENVRWLRWMAAAAVVALAATAGVWFVRSGTANRDPVPMVRPSPITSGDAWEGEPALAPDGERIAYVSNADSQFDIYVVAASGGQPLRVTDHAAHDRAPAWFPSGNEIAFVSDRLGSESIWKTGQYGGGATLLLEDARDPDISPDGSMLAFTRRSTGGEGRIGVVPLDDPTATRLLTSGDQHGLWDHREPAWSRAGDRLCYSAKNNLWLVDLATGKIRQLTRDGREDRMPAWSPDDSHVYFESLRGNVRGLWRVRVDDGHTVRLTHGGGNERHPGVASTGRRLVFHTVSAGGADLLIVDRVAGHTSRLAGQHTDSFPALTPDGSKLVFVSDRRGERSEVWIQDLSGDSPHGAARRLTEQPGHASHPDISPDGRWVAYYRFDGDARDLWVVSATGGQPRQITTHPGSDIQPTWSPDGSHLAFASDREGEFAVWVVPVNNGDRGGDPIRVTSLETAALRPIWSWDGNQIAFCAAGEVWLVAADGGTRSRRLTDGAQADRARWDGASNRLWVSGLWGEGHLSLRTISPVGGEPQTVTPRYGADDPDREFFFDISRDGGVLVLTDQHPLARVWLLEATDGEF